MTTKNFCDIDSMPSMDELLSNSQAELSIGEGKIVTGTIVQKNDKGLNIDINYKSELFVGKEEIRDFDSKKVGDSIDVWVAASEDENEDRPVISVRKAEQQKAWESIAQNNKEGDVIKGLVKSRVKGGFVVDVGVEAFLPGSQVDLGSSRANLDDYIGKELDFQIIKITADRQNLVLSRRSLLEADRNQKREKLLAELKVGQVRRGTVKNITSFGAFVDLDGMDGLLHITDMSWRRISNPNEVVHLNQELDVMVLKINVEEQRISLGLKQMEGNPWDTCDTEYPVGAHVKGKVVNVLPYGAFVELAEGIEGLVHVSEMSWTKKITRASDMLKEGDEVEVVILSVDKENRKISLGLRQTQTNPWELIKQEFPKGTHIKGVVRNMTGYGAFVQIKDDIDGMIHISDMSWTRKINHPSEVLKKGDMVEAVIMDVDVENQRISLSTRMLSDDPWQSISSRYSVGDIVEGKVTKLASFGAFVELEGGVDGLIHISELSEEHVEKVKDVVQVGATVKCRVKNISSEEKRIGLSMRDLDGTATPAEAAPSFAPAAGGLGGLGGALDAAFAEKKDEE